MCIIAAKPAGVSMPDYATLRRMWDANPDGAGFMYPETLTKNGKQATKIRVRKGFMEFDHFVKALEELGKKRKLKDTALVMHFRITTHGGTCPELTHPFPVTDSKAVLRKLSATADVGVAHNGIISSVRPTKGMSDTSEYIATQLAPLSRALPRFWENKDALELIRNGIGSKMAILAPDGRITTVGEFNEDNGIMYSNYSWMDYRPVTYFSTYSGWSSARANKVRGKRIMSLTCTKDACVKLSNGDLLSVDFNDDWGIDSTGDVYAYDDLLDRWVHTPGAVAQTSTGGKVRFDSKEATFELTISEAYAEELYADMEDAPF